MKKLVEFMTRNDLAEVEYKDFFTKIRLVRKREDSVIPVIQNSQMSDQGSAHEDRGSSMVDGTTEKTTDNSDEKKLVEITSPMVGTFYASQAPGKPPYVTVGDRVTKGQPLCIVEAMKIMNELPSEYSGIIREVCVSNEDPVEFGQVLFRIETE